MTWRPSCSTISSSGPEPLLVCSELTVWHCGHGAMNSKVAAIASGCQVAVPAVARGRKCMHNTPLLSVQHWHVHVVSSQLYIMTSWRGSTPPVCQDVGARACRER